MEPEDLRKQRLAYQAKWRSENRDKQREYGRQYRERNRALLCERARAYKAANPEKVKANRLKNRERQAGRGTVAYRKLRSEVLNQYGGRCVCCDESNECFLSIDHTRNDGAKHRRGKSPDYHGSGVSIYRWLKQHKYPAEGFQVLCYNCNCSKQHDPAGHRKAHPRASLIDGLGDLPLCRSTNLLPNFGSNGSPPTH